MSALGHFMASVNLFGMCQGRSDKPVGDVQCKALSIFHMRTDSHWQMVTARH